MALTAEQCERLTEALVKAFVKKPPIERVVRFGLNENLDAIVGGDSLTDVVYNLVIWTEAQERLEELLIAARKANRQNALLKAASEEVLATLLEVPQERLESIVLKSVSFTDIEQWLERIRYCSLAVCCVEIAGVARGTGFLVEPDQIITNYHVVEEVIDDPRLQSRVVLRFHYKTEPNGRRQSTGVECYLASRNWLVASSPIRRWDYALVRIDTSNFQRHRYAGRWLTPQSHTFALNEPVCIIQHPLGNPQKIALGAVSRINAEQDRIHYRVNTLQGSSGSPCINNNGFVVALHQQEGDTTSNKGIPFSAILKDLG